MEILGAFTGSFGEQGSFSGVFRYTKADLTNMETFGVYADVSAESKLQLDSEYQPSLDSYSIFSMPFELDGQMKYAVINKAETQVSTDSIDLDIQILDYTGGSSTMQLHAVYADSVLYPSLEDQLILDPYIPIEDITDAIDGGQIVTVDYTDYYNNYHGGIVLQSYHTEDTPSLFARGLYLEKETNLIFYVDL